MDGYSMDLDEITSLLTAALKWMERLTPLEITAMINNDDLRDMILEAIGINRKLLSPKEQEWFSALLRSALRRISFDRVTREGIR